MGKPVLSTQIPSLERYQKRIELVKEGDSESYAKALDKLAAQSNSEEMRILRKKAITGDSWRDRGDQFRQIALADF
jgi:hypothetical protein